MIFTVTMFTAVVEPLQWNTTVFLKWGDGKHQWTLSDIKIWWWLIYFSRVCKKRFPIGLSWSFVYFNLHSLCDSPYISVKGLLIGNTFSYLLKKPPLWIFQFLIIYPEYTLEVFLCVHVKYTPVRNSYGERPIISNTSFL